MSIKIALAGNPNAGKTTLFNALTGANQFVGNWPGVTVEKKEGKLKKNTDVIVTDLPGIYSLSPYTLEEVVARDYLKNENPSVILNIVDATNLERNLYLTTQLIELGIPVVIALNMIDVVRKSGDRINVKELERELGVPVVEISALKGDGVEEVTEKCLKAASGSRPVPPHIYSGATEHTIAHIEEAALHSLPESEQRWYAIKIFERDRKAYEKLNIDQATLNHIEEDIKNAEKEMDDDAESIITNERYIFIASLIKNTYTKKKTGLSTSDKIDKVVTNRYLALPIFALIMWLVYYISVTTVGGWATDWANDGVFGDGWHLFGIGTGAYSEDADEYSSADTVLSAFAEEKGIEFEEYDAETVKKIVSASKSSDVVTYTVEDEETLAQEDETATYEDLLESAETMEELGYAEPDPASYGVWVPGIPALIESLLDKIGCADWLKGLVLDGIVAGVGAVLGFVPQIFVLFIFLAFLEGCGYMARIAFVMDRIFRKFGLSGKSFIPILIGTGCGIPGIMASRTIENEKDRRMTIMTTTFIPCGAKLPFIAMIAGSIFGGASWVAPCAYFLGMFAIISSGIILKKTKLFAGDPAPFVMELPAYHLPTVGSILRSMWERGWAFIKKAGTIILLSTIFIWFTTYFGFAPEGFRMLSDEEIEYSILARIGSVFGWLFAPLGWGNWQAAVASITGLVAKENIVGTLGILYGATGNAYAGISAAFTSVTGFSFLAFNLLCAPCFAAMGAISREMNSRKWTWAAIGWECGFAYCVAFVITQLGNMFTGRGNVVLFIIALLVIALYVYELVFKKAKKVQA